MTNKYKEYTPEQVEELLSNYLIDSWSYSKVSAFARNEKAFERLYVYNETEKSSASNVAGKAYHYALDSFFRYYKEGTTLDIAELHRIAYVYIETIPAELWKQQKTTPTIQECIQKATQDATVLLNNFLSEVNIYISNIQEVLFSEHRMTEWVCVNGVDIPMPLHSVADLIIKGKDGKTVIIDHKSKAKLTDEAELRFTVAKQAVAYTLAYESETGETVDEVWFVENKISKNKDGSPQLSKFEVVMDKETRRLYEAILYEPLRSMIKAVSDPDYIYLINDSDNLTDKAELYSFWTKTMLAEIEDFNIPENKKPLIQKRLKKIRDVSLSTATPTAIRNFQKYAEQFIPYDLTNKKMTNQEKIEHVLRSFGIISKVQHTFEGYSSCSYLLELNAGTVISSIKKYALDMANALNVSNVRVQKDLYVHDGKAYLAIESGKKTTDTLAWDKSKLKGYKIPLGIDNFGKTVIWDMDNNSTPHMLICGATGSGKSVSIRSTIEYAILAGVNEVYIFDPKHEFRDYSKRAGFTVVNEIEDIELQMGMLVLDMQDRVKYNKRHKTLIVFDEFADAVANSRKGNELKNYKEVACGNYANGMIKTKRECVSEDKSLEENMRILLQKGRSSGFRIIAATQRASTKVITGDAKVNFPVQVCFRVPKDVDSQVVLDEPGAEALNGRGDGLIKSPEYLGVVRFQGFFKD